MRAITAWLLVFEIPSNPLQNQGLGIPVHGTFASTVRTTMHPFRSELFTATGQLAIGQLPGDEISDLSR